MVHLKTRSWVSVVHVVMVIVSLPVCFTKTFWLILTECQLIWSNKNGTLVAVRVVNCKTWFWSFLHLNVEVFCLLFVGRACLISFWGRSIFLEWETGSAAAMSLQWTEHHSTESSVVMILTPTLVTGPVALESLPSPDCHNPLGNCVRRNKIYMLWTGEFVSSDWVQN